MLGARIWSTGKNIKVKIRLGFIGSVEIDNQVMAYPDQSSDKQAGRLFIPANRLPCFEKDLLCQVLGIGNIAYPVVDMSVHPINVHIVEPPEGIGITIFSSIYQSVNFRQRVGSVVFL